jgi:hypothetical protein
MQGVAVNKAGTFSPRFAVYIANFRIHMKYLVGRQSWSCAVLTILGLIAVTPFVQAGSIGFSVSFLGEEISISNTGSDAAYHLSEWTLNSENQWRKTQVIDGNDAYLAPGKTLKARRPSLPAEIGLGKADPFLLVLYDQAGSRIAQLAWRHAPAIQPQPLPAMRNGAEVMVAASTALDQKVAITYALVVPYEGIERLAQPLSWASVPPSNPIRHTWASGQPLVIDAGQGQAGVWLVHETAQGELHLQIVPDGFLRGQEQVPAWLMWTRQYLMTVAMVLAALGALTMVFGFVRQMRLQAPLKRG